MMVRSSNLHSQQTFFQLLHNMYLRTVDPLLKDTQDAVVHRIQIWQISWPYLWRAKLLASLSLSLCSMVTVSRAR